MFLNLIDTLQNKLKDALPGIRAHDLMMPTPVNAPRFSYEVREDARQSSVMILLYPDKNVAYLPLILRPTYTGAHSGQISLPGGKEEPDDLSREHTALREMEEEIGVSANDVVLLGNLTEIYVAASNFRVMPVVGYLNFKPNFIPEIKEVAEILISPLEAIIAVERKKEKEMLIGGQFAINSPYFDINGKVVWGATAMILSELATIIREM
jgi:8-oxo-dGTP pyrophosphatase MutT (NUDIX family)